MDRREQPPPRDQQQQQQQRLRFLVVLFYRAALIACKIDVESTPGPLAAPAAAAATAAAAAAVTSSAAATATMTQRSQNNAAASLLLLLGSVGAAAAAAAGAAQEVAVLEQDVGAGPAARPEAAAAAEGSLPQSRITAHFSLGGRSYQLPLSAGSTSGTPSRHGGPKRGLVEKAALSAAGSVLCLILFTIAKDLAAAAKAKYKKRQQQLAIKALSTQRHAALAAMRQAAEFLLQLQPDVQQQQHQQKLLAAAANVEAKLLELGDSMPETDRIGHLLISQLMKATGVETPDQQQQQHVQGGGSDMEGFHLAARSLLSGRTSSSSSGAHALYEEPEYLGHREEPQQWLPELDEEAWGPGQSSEELYQAMVAEGATLGGASPATLERMELLNALLSENVDLSNKDALLIISGVQGAPLNVPKAPEGPSDLYDSGKLTEE
ncbi:hypothetical protein ACSSS7_001784 [Eimeria intestinalis]